MTYLLPFPAQPNACALYGLQADDANNINVRVYDVASGLVSDFNAQACGVSYPSGYLHDWTQNAASNFLALTPSGQLLTISFMNYPFSLYQIGLPPQLPPLPPVPSPPPARVYPPDLTACGDVAHQLVPLVSALDSVSNTFPDTGVVGGWRWKPVKKDPLKSFSTTTTSACVGHVVVCMLALTHAPIPLLSRSHNDRL